MLILWARTREEALHLIRQIEAFFVFLFEGVSLNWWLIKKNGQQSYFDCTWIKQEYIQGNSLFNQNETN